FVLSALIAGIAGALYVPQVGIINPSEFNPLISIEIVIWVAIGGRGTLYGAVIGAVLVNYAKTTFTSGMFAEYWLFILGGLFVITTIYLPRGVVGILDSYLSKRRRGDKQADAAPQAPADLAAATGGKQPLTIKKFKVYYISMA